MRRWRWRKHCTTHSLKSTERRAYWRKGGPRQRRGIAEGCLDLVRVPKNAATERERCGWFALLSDRQIPLFRSLTRLFGTLIILVVQITHPPTHPPLLTISTFLQRVEASPPRPYRIPPLSLVIVCLLSSSRFCVCAPLHSLFSCKQRWEHLIEADKMVLAGLAFDSSRQQSEMANMAMEIRGLRVPLIEPQPPSVS